MTLPCIFECYMCAKHYTMSHSVPLSVIKYEGPWRIFEGNFLTPFSILKRFTQIGKVSTQHELSSLSAHVEISLSRDQCTTGVLR